MNENGIPKKELRIIGGEPTRTPELNLYTGLALASKEGDAGTYQVFAIVADNEAEAIATQTEQMRLKFPDCEIKIDGVGTIPKPLLLNVFSGDVNNYFLQMVRRGGQIVTAAAVPPGELELAIQEARFIVDRDGYHYVYLPPRPDYNPLSRDWKFRALGEFEKPQPDYTKYPLSDAIASGDVEFKAPKPYRTR